LTTSIISLCAMVAELPDRKDDDAEEWQRAQKWAVSVASISIAFSTFGAVGAALGREKFNGSKAESTLVSDEDIHNLNIALRFEILHSTIAVHILHSNVFTMMCLTIFFLLYLSLFTVDRYYPYLLGCWTPRYQQSRL
jgi:hypothetical protein